MTASDAGSVTSEIPHSGTDTDQRSTSAMEQQQRNAMAMAPKCLNCSTAGSGWQRGILRAATGAEHGHTAGLYLETQQTSQETVQSTCASSWQYKSHGHGGWLPPLPSNQGRLLLPAVVRHSGGRGYAHACAG